MDDTLAISALQHYAYCPRQFALIHVEQSWDENYFTAHGRVLHERVDQAEPEQRRGVRFERSVLVASETLGIQGKLDLLEIVSPKSGGNTAYCPVEYKRGKAKIEDWDRIQLCAQALCLEEMRQTTIHTGALWYWKTRKREQVEIDDPLREKTKDAIAQARAILQSGTTPPPLAQSQYKKRCAVCSLVDLCQPKRFGRDRSQAYVQALFASEELDSAV